MERPGFESPLCALSTNRSLSATIRKLPLDRCAFFHRRMTNLISNTIMLEFFYIFRSRRLRKTTRIFSRQRSSSAIRVQSTSGEI